MPVLELQRILHFTCLLIRPSLQGEQSGALFCAVLGISGQQTQDQISAHLLGDVRTDFRTLS